MIAPGIRETSGVEEVAILPDGNDPLAVRQQSHEALAAKLRISSDDRYAQHELCYESLI